MPPSRMIALLGTWRADSGWHTVNFILPGMLERSLFVEPCLQLPECSCRNHLCDHSAIHRPAVDTGDTSIDLLGLILSSGAIRMSKSCPKGASPCMAKSFKSNLTFHTLYFRSKAIPLSCPACRSPVIINNAVLDPQPRSSAPRRLGEPILRYCPRFSNSAALRSGGQQNHFFEGRIDCSRNSFLGVIPRLP